MIMRVGIPKALLYYRYRYLWEDFFKALQIDYVVSPDTNQEIINRGTLHAVDEACLSCKIYLGHVDWLLDKCDLILVPRISNLGTQGTVCTRFQALYDIINNTFRDQDIKLLPYNIDIDKFQGEMRACLKMGSSLGKRKYRCVRAYLTAKQAEKQERLTEEKSLQQSLGQDGIKVLMIAYDYNLCDKCIGGPILSSLINMGVVPIPGNMANRNKARARSMEISETLPWAFSKELVGTAALYKDRVDGIILLSTFPCGPDSMANEMIMRRIKEKPILNLILDGQEGAAGIQTRLESFVDIIEAKRNVC